MVGSYRIIETGSGSRGLRRRASMDLTHSLDIWSLKSARGEGPCTTYFASSSSMAKIVSILSHSNPSLETMCVIAAD